MAASVLSSLLPESIFGASGIPFGGCCGGSPPLKGMEIKLKYAIPKGINMSGFQLDVTLDITNPNKASLCTTGFSYKVAQKKATAEGEEETPAAVLAEGTMEEGIHLPGGVTTTVVVPVSCTYGGVGSLGKSLLMGERIHFIMSGDTRYKIPLTETSYTLPYKVEGSFSPRGGGDDSNNNKEANNNKKDEKEPEGTDTTEKEN